jgi:hypothetical protein
MRIVRGEAGGRKEGEETWQESRRQVTAHAPVTCRSAAYFINRLAWVLVVLLCKPKWPSAKS